MPSVLRAPQLTQQGFLHGFSPRQGGVSAAPYASLNLGRSVGDDAAHVAENRRRFAAWVGYAPEALFEVNQVHGSAVRCVGPAEDPSQVRKEEGDALVAAGGAAIGVRTADCVPILLADPHTRQVSAVHAGWRGAAAGIVPAAVRALCEAAQAPASRLYAGVFPHIRSCCFEIGEEVAAQLAACAPELPVVLSAAPDSKPHAALDALVRWQLTAAGIAAAQVDDVPGCARCDVEHFFSFRRDGKASGRHLTAIVSG